MIWCLWGVLLGLVIWGSGIGSRPTAASTAGAQNAFIGFADAVLRRDPAACGMLTADAARQLLDAVGAPIALETPQRRAIAACHGTLARIPIGRVEALLPVRDRRLLDGVSQAGAARVTIVFGDHQATLENTPALGWRVTAIRKAA